MKFRTKRWLVAAAATILTVGAGVLVNPEAANATSNEILTAWSSDKGAYGTVVTSTYTLTIQSCDKAADGHHSLTQLEAWNGTTWHVFLDVDDYNGYNTCISDDLQACNGRIRIRVATMEGNLTIAEGWSIYENHTGADWSCF